MLTTNDLAERTGLSAKTLTRWRKSGILPAPVIGTHPSGRGKTGYWPEWVVDRCEHIKRLRREGHSLRSAALEADREVSSTGSGKAPTDDSGGLARFYSLVVASLRHLMIDSSSRQNLAEQIDHALLNSTRDLWHDGYNPVVTYDGREAHVTADFMISLNIASGTSRAGMVVVPLSNIMAQMHASESRDSSTRYQPAPKAWCVEGKTWSEYEVVTGGRRGFGLVDRSVAVQEGRVERLRLDGQLDHE